MEKLQKDIEYLQKDYSSFRCGNKWRSYRTSYIPGQQLTDDPNYLKVIRQSLSVIDYYSIQSLLKRNKVKRSASIFIEIHKLWLSINPGNLRGISKSLYKVVIEHFYKQFQQSMANPRIIDVYISQDTEIDFELYTSLTFCEFYDIIFEVLDSLAKSSLVSEYSRLVFNTLSQILDSSQFASLNLYSKLHLYDIIRPSIHSWMHDHVRNLTPTRNLTQLPEILKNSSGISLAPKFLSRVLTKPIRETLPIKWKLQKFLLESKEKSTFRSKTPTLDVSYKSSSFTKLKPSKKVPLSITPVKERKETFIIEDVVEERVGRKLNALV